MVPPLWLSMGLKPGGDPHAALRPQLRQLKGPAPALTTTSPHAGPAAHQEFTGASWDGDLLLQCTRTQVLWLDVAAPQGPRIVQTLDHPWFQDLHHAVRLRDGRLAVAVTGLDAVFFFSAELTLQSTTWLRGDQAAFHATYALDRDLRTVPVAQFKPHSHHPNHLTEHDGKLWVTLLHGSQCVPLDLDSGQIDHRSTLALPGDGAHDGVLRDGLWWFTTVDGTLYGCDPHTRAVQWQAHIPTLEAAPGHPGWCRAIEVIGHHAWVGLSVLRHSRHREAFRRLLRGPQAVKQPTRVVCVDLRDRSVVSVHPVGNQAGGTLYSIKARPRAPHSPPPDGAPH